MLVGCLVVGIIAPKCFVPALLDVWFGQIVAHAVVPWLAANVGLGPVPRARIVAVAR